MKTSLLRKTKSKGTIIMKQSGIINDLSFLNGHGHESNWDSNNLHPELYMN